MINSAFPMCRKKHYPDGAVSYEEAGNAAAYVIGAFLGDSSISMMNPKSGALVSESIRVDLTLVGQQTSGGACVVYRLSAADESLFQLFGLKRLSYMKNDSFYDIDQGTAPDFVIPDPVLLYDRK